MNLRSLLCFCIGLGTWLNIIYPSAILFGDYPYPTEATEES